MSTRIAWDRILREFALVIPDDVTVTALNMTAPSNAPVPPGTPPSGTPGFNLQGTTFSHDSVARLLSRLMLMPDLTNVALTTSAADLGTGQVTFTVTATVKGAPPPLLPEPVATDTTTTGSSS